MRDWSTNIDLDEQVDVIVTETIGDMGFEEGITGWIIDARKRLLKPNGRVIPQTVEMIAAPVESARAYAAVEDWSSDTHTMDTAPARTLAANQIYRANLSHQELLSEPARMATATLAHVERAETAGRFVVRRYPGRNDARDWGLVQRPVGGRLDVVQRPPTTNPQLAPGVPAPGAAAGAAGRRPRASRTLQRLQLRPLVLVRFGGEGAQAGGGHDGGPTIDW